MDTAVPDADWTFESDLNRWGAHRRYRRFGQRTASIAEQQWREFEQTATPREEFVRCIR
jgi:hypothetical protein